MVGVNEVGVDSKTEGRDELACLPHLDVEGDRDKQVSDDGGGVWTTGPNGRTLGKGARYALHLVHESQVDGKGETRKAAETVELAVGVLEEGLVMADGAGRGIAPVDKEREELLIQFGEELCVSVGVGRSLLPS